MITDRIPSGRRNFDRFFNALGTVSIGIGILLLIIVIAGAVKDGIHLVSPEFLTRRLSPTRPARTGVLTPMIGSAYIVGLTILLSVPIGIAAAIYLEELTRPSRLREFIQTNVSNLAGVPSIIYGILGLALFVRAFQLGQTVIAAALTMSLLVLPTVILVTREALRMVPQAYREGSIALGATQWQTLFGQILPVAFPNIITGIILSASRAIGESAPLMVIGAATYMRKPPSGLFDGFTVMPIQIYYWSSDSRRGFVEVASAAILVLMAVLLTLNLTAMFLRTRARRV